MLPTLPTPPSRDDPVNFAPRADAFLAALPAWTDAANALEQSLQLVATTGTSTTSLTIGTGSKTLTTQSGKAWATGAFVYVVSSAGVANLMIGQVTAYNTSTGSLTVNAVTSTGSGTLASWVIGLSAPLGSSATFSGTVTAAAHAVDSTYSMTLLVSNPLLQFDTGDYIWYDRATNKMGFSVGSVDRFTVDATDGPQRTTDASTANGLVRKSQMDAAVSAGPAVLGAFRALAASATGASAIVSVSADELIIGSAANAYTTLRAVSLSINAAGSGANGLDTGTLAANTWYSVWVIYNGTTTAGLLSLSPTSPTMPGGYTHKARVGWVRTDGSADKYPLAFRQAGRYVRYVVAGNVSNPPIVASGNQGSVTTPTWVSVLVRGAGAVTPPTASCIDIGGASNNASVIAAPSNSYGGYSHASNRPPLDSSFAGSNSLVMARLMLESDSIYVASNDPSGYVCVFGWEDNL